MGKKKAGKKQNDYWDDQFEQDAASADASPAVEEESLENQTAAFNAAVELNEDEDDSLMAMVSKAAKNKAKKAKKQSVQDDVAKEDADEEKGPSRILTKREKEKLKKEREKEEKRKAALERKAQGVDSSKQKDEVSESNVKANEETSKPEKDNTATPETAPEAAPEAVSSTKKAKKKVPGNIAALRKMVEAQKAAEEEHKRQLEEEQKRIEDEEKKAAQEQAEKEEKSRLKREKEAAKKEQLRKEGKLLTKAQKEAKRLAELRLKQMLADDKIVIAGLNKAEDSEEVQKKRPVYDSKRKKKGPSIAELEKKKQEAEKKKQEELLKQKESEAKEASDDEDDWEKALLSSDNENDIKEDVKSDWENESEEESTGPAATTKPASSTPTKVATSKTNASAPANKAPSKSRESSDEDESSQDSSEDDSDDDSDEDSSEEELTAAQKLALQKKEEAAARREERHKNALAARSKDDLRSPICCILGHVDTGKTKLLDKIRQTNVQEGEAGGITQQIGATYFPVDAIREKTAVLGDKRVEELKLPGLLIIDTPGHESFTNLRSRGSSLCNIAILVVDIMHGLEPQTLESIRLLRDRKTPFIVALNKIDRLFGWKAIPDNSFEDSLAKQEKSVREEFEDRANKTMLAFAEQGLNSQLYYKNKNVGKYVSLVPTSAHSGEGIPDMLNLLVSLTQTRMSDKLMYVTELECTVLEVKVIEGLGTTIDVVLVNGWLHEGDKIVVCGLNGPIVTQVRALLTPQPMRELRIKSQYVHNKSVKAALGIKISAPDLEKAIAGSRLFVCGPDDDEEDLKDEVMADLTNLMSSIDRSGHGVWVQASTLGSLEALLEFLKTSKIPVSGINIGPVYAKDVKKASVMLEKAPEYAVMLCFDVKVDKDAEDLAKDAGIKIFKAEIIYHLFDAYTKHHEAMMEQKRKDQAHAAVFPCVLKIVPQAVFNKKDPIIIGVDVIDGALRIGTPICVVKSRANNVPEVFTLGKVKSMEKNHKPLDHAKKGEAGIAIRIDRAPSDPHMTFGRHWEESDELYSKISRQSIDILKSSFRAEVSKEEWGLIVKLKKKFNIE